MRVEGNDSPLLCLDVFKISKGEGSNQSFLLFGYFKNQDGEEKRGNDLNRKIYTFLKIDLQHWSMINLLEYFFF